MAIDIIARGMAASLPQAAVLTQDAMIIRSPLKTRTALGRVMGRTGRMRIACFGDSTTANNLGTRQAAWPSLMATALTNLGVPAIAKSFFGPGTGSSPTRAAYLTHNPEITTMDTDWGFSGSVRSLGANVFTNTTGTGKITWTIPGTVDTIKLYHLSGNVGAFNYDVDGGTATNIVTTGTQTFTETVLSPTRGSHVVNITRVSGTANFVGALAYDSTAPAIDILNLGYGGGTTGALAVTTNPWSTANALAALAPDLTIIILGINDDLAGTSAAVVSPDMQTIITKALISGDVWLCRPTPIQTSNVDYTAMYQALAQTNSSTYVDLRAALGGSYTAANALSLMFDSNHPNAAGYVVEGAFMARRLMSL